MKGYKVVSRTTIAGAPYYLSAASSLAIPKGGYHRPYIPNIETVAEPRAHALGYDLLFFRTLHNARRFVSANRYAPLFIFTCTARRVHKSLPPYLNVSRPIWSESNGSAMGHLWPPGTLMAEGITIHKEVTP